MTSETIALAKKLDGAIRGNSSAPDVNEDEGFIVKVLGGRDDVGPGSASKQLPRDHFEELTREGQVIPPLYNPSVWSFLLEQSTRLGTLVHKMADNTVGLGWEIVPKKDEERFLEENKEQIEDERRRLVEFFESPNPEASFNEMMKYVKIDEESTGQGYLEVTRNEAGEVAQLFHIPSYTVRWMSGGEVFVQMRPGNQSKKVYFKQFGDDRALSVSTGKFQSEGGDEIPFEDRASELIQFRLYTPRSSFYGVPRYVPAAQAIAGNKLAQRRNVAFFENDSPQPLTAKVLTPQGWSTMGAMQVGSLVTGRDGKAHKVTGVYPQGTPMGIYRVWFSDNSWADCTLNHVWSVHNSYDRKRGVARLMSLQELIEDGFRYESGCAKWAIPLTEPVEYVPQGPLAIDPYLMGLLLGNGYLSNGCTTLSTFIQDSDEIQAEIIPMLPAKVYLARRDRGMCSEFAFRRTLGSLRCNQFAELIRGMGLAGARARTKFIPMAYMIASVSDRIALLQGLIDTDGHVNGSLVRYVTASDRLASGVQELVGSLGGVCTCSPITGKNDMWQLTIRQLPEWITPARVARKAHAYSPAQKPRLRTMERTEFLGTAEAQCIRVDSPDSLYITDNWVLTHNTPRFAVIINGGALSEKSIELIEDFANSEGKGPGNASRALILQAKNSDAFADTSKVNIQLMPLTIGVTDDASFLRYMDSNNEEIREAFSIGKIFLGTSDDVNRAVAIAMKQVTLEQAFEPEIKRYEYRLNTGLLRDMGIETVKLMFTRPKTTDITSEAQAQGALAAAGGITPNDLRQWLNKDKFNAKWADTPIAMLRLGLLEDRADPLETLMHAYGDRLPQPKPPAGEAAAKSDEGQALVALLDGLRGEGVDVAMMGVDNSDV